MMQNLKKMTFFVFAFTALTFAGGAASVVGHKSKTMNYTYSYSTQYDFLDACSRNANKRVCWCVLGKLERKYSENEYLKLDRDLREGYRQPDFVKFIARASESCDAEYSGVSNDVDYAELLSNAPAAEPVKNGVAEEEAKKFAEIFKDSVPKKKFVPACADLAKTFYGLGTAKRVCGCAYDRMTSNIPRFTKMVAEYGLPGTDDAWGMEYMLECAPNKFTHEIEKNMVAYLNEAGVPLSVSKCIMDVVKKEYTPKSLFKALANNRDTMIAVLLALGDRCVER